MKIVKKFGGGGGGGGGTTSTIPDWMKPYVEQSLKQATGSLQSGELSRVAGTNEIQKTGQASALNAAQLGGNVALHSGEALGQLGKVAAGEEIVPTSTGATNAIKAAAVHEAGIKAQPGIAAAAARGTIGGSRQLIQAGAGQNDLAAKFAGIDYQDLQSRRSAAQSAAGQVIQGGGAVQDQLLNPARVQTQVGKEIQTQTQTEADAPFQGLSRFSSLIQGTPWQSQQQTQGGK